MYGAGHEPTTVEQFRQDFPEEMYDYSPRCWLTSYKRNLVCETKNLLSYPYYNTTNTNQGVTFTDNGDGSITVNGTPTGPAIFYFTDYVYKAGVFTLSGISLDINLAFGVDYFNSDLALISEINRPGSFTFDTSTHSDFACFRLYVKRKENGVEINNYTFKTMLELGDTATDYVPYGYLTSYQRNLTCKTKNLFDIDSVSFFTKDSNGEYKSNKFINTEDILWKPTDGAKQVTISGYIKCPVGKNYRFMIVYVDGTELYRELDSTGNYIYQAITSNSSKVVSFIGLTYSSSSNEVYIKDVQIEYGSSATSYVPYQYL